MSDTEDLPIVPMELGLRVDILDNEGIWNTGKIVDVSRDEEDMVEIKYDGWGDEYNEWIPLSAHRLAPLHMFTMVKKCWAKLTKWPWWPAFVVLRAPTKKSAADALNAESKIYVEFFDSYNEEKRSRCWMQKKNIASFQEGFDERASKNIGKNFPAYVEGTQRAMAGGSPVLFTNNGTLPIEYSSKYTEPLEARKQALAQGDESKWFDAYRIFSNRYRVLYGYDFARDSAKTLIAAQHAKGKRAANGSGAKGKSHAEEDDDDEVEIIETVAPVKRGRGRPPGKQAKKQPKREMLEDEDGDEEDDEQEPKGKRAKKDGDDEYEDAGEDEEGDEEEEEEAEDSDSARGRRSFRLTKKRKPSQADDSTPTRRATRPRRAKDDEDDEGEFMNENDEDDDYGDEGEDFNHYEYEDHAEEKPSSSAPRRFHGRAPSRSTSPDTRYTPRTRTSKKVHKRSALKELLATTKPQPVLVAPPSTSRLPSAATSSSLPPSKPVMRQLEAFLIGAKTKSTPCNGGSTGSRSTNGSSVENSPASVKITTDSSHRASSQGNTSSNSGRNTTKTEASPLRYWLGFGAATETGTGAGAAHKPWSIQSWLLNGFQRKHDAESDKSGGGG